MKKINDEINENEKNIDQINSYLSETLKTDDLIKYYSNIIISKEKENILKQELIEKNNSENNTKKEISPENELVYQIDLYLEKINKLDDIHKYNLLDKLIKMYGREAYTHRNENKNFIYYKYGEKIITCKHNLHLIDAFKNKEKFTNNLEKLKKDYGIEDDGHYWCKHCGQELFISDFETIEGFSKSGARIITHEELVDDDNQEKNQIMKIQNLLKLLNLISIKKN